MKSIRPMVTITILTVVGAFLFQRMREGPALDETANSEWTVQPGVPSLDTTGSNAAPESPFAPPAAGDGTTSAPTWSAPAPSTEMANTSGGAAFAPQAATPTVPQVPDLPELTPPTQPTQGMTPVVPPNVPVARYPDSGPQLTPPSTSGPMAVSGQVPSLGTATPDLVAAAGATSSPWPATTSTTTTSTVTTPSDTTPLPAPPPDPAQTGYATTKPLIQDSLNRGDLTAAHLLLSEWHGNESLTPAERQEVETLLNQLAGTVIYSTEHRLEPAYTVRPGNTLETIAQQYQVPWQLLAKINGIPQADAVQPGQQLKVVRGPFSAAVNPATNELTLELNGLYAGKFTVDVPQAVQLGEGEFVVENKAQQQGSMMLRSTSAYSSTPTLTLGSAAPTAQPTPGTPANLGVAAQDANELCDILSVGSRVVIRR